MQDLLRSLLELGLLSAALVLASWAMALQRRPEPIPDWPPSPPPPKHVKRDLVVTGASMLFLIAGVGVAMVTLTVTVYLAIAGPIGPAPG
jgi:hypothetical protein